MFFIVVVKEGVQTTHFQFGCLSAQVAAVDALKHAGYEIARTYLGALPERSLEERNRASRIIAELFIKRKGTHL